MSKKVVYLLIIVILFLGGCVMFKNKNNHVEEPAKVTRDLKEYSVDDFNLKLIKTVNSGYESNYLISPYSIEIALNMLKEGTNGDTLNELKNVLNERDIPDLTNDKVKIANAMFIKKTYKDYIEEVFYNNLKEKYNSEILYDEFSTPKVINSWVKKKTDSMIPKILNDISKDFVLGLANAIAIDVKWNSTFDCNSTIESVFTRVDNSKINVQMMHKTYETENYKYFEDANSKGIIIPYENNLEFVGILPNDTIDGYVNAMTKDTIRNIDKNTTNASNDVHILLSLPRFSYSFDLDNFKDVLKHMGINSIFDEDNADFTNIISKKNMNKLNMNNLYVSTAIHKTYIDLNESGTKAAAVTYFGLMKSTAVAPKAYKQIEINFDKPFIYMIRDSETKEILFFGTVYEPNLWNGSTCED